MDHYCVFGNPIAQSKSPIIHQMFAAQVGHGIEYDRKLAAVDNFIQTLEAFFDDKNAMGCNVTAPFKEQVAAWVNVLSPQAEIAGSVNTVVRQPDGSFVGHTTDGVGLVQDLLRLGVTLGNANILLLGAGGAARGVMQPLLDQQPQLLTIANRTESKAKDLATLLPNENLVSASFENLVDCSFDLIINSTSASLTGELPPIPDSVIANCSSVYDMSYGDKPTVFMQHASDLGIQKTFDGLGMLVGQAAESFYLWRGVRPETTPVIEKLRSAL